LKFERLLAQYKQKINSEIINLFKYEHENYGLLKNYILMGGKRLRPISLIMAYWSYSDEIEKIMGPSLCIELLHTSSMIFDDIMDEDDFRRNNPGVQKKCKEIFLDKNSEINYNGNIFSKASKRYAASRSILIGLLAEILSRKVLLESGFSKEKICRCLQIMDEGYAELINGQTMDLEFESRKSISEDEYLDMIEKKTASLFSAGMQIGAVLGGGDPAIFDRYARLAGTAFQIQDDLMDINPEYKKGRTLGGDIKKGKKTLVVIKALETLSGKEKLTDYLGKQDLSKKEINEAIDILMDCGAVSYAKKVALQNLNNAKKIISQIPNPEFFLDFADYLFYRKV